MERITKTGETLFFVLSTNYELITNLRIYKNVYSDGRKAMMCTFVNLYAIRIFVGLWITSKNGLETPAWHILDLWYNGLTVHNI